VWLCDGSKAVLAFLTLDSALRDGVDRLIKAVGDLYASIAWLPSVPSSASWWRVSRVDENVQVPEYLRAQEKWWRSILDEFRVESRTNDVRVEEHLSRSVAALTTMLEQRIDAVLTEAVVLRNELCEQLATVVGELHATRTDLGAQVDAVVGETARATEAIEQCVAGMAAELQTTVEGALGTQLEAAVVQAGGVAAELRRELAAVVTGVCGVTSGLGAQVEASTVQTARAEQRIDAVLTEAVVLRNELREQLATVVGELHATQTDLGAQVDAAVGETARATEAIEQCVAAPERAGRSTENMRQIAEGSPQLVGAENDFSEPPGVAGRRGAERQELDSRPGVQAEPPLPTSNTLGGQSLVPDKSDTGEWEGSWQLSPTVPYGGGWRNVVEKYAYPLLVLAVLILSALVSYLIA